MSVRWEGEELLLQPITPERPCGENLEDTELLASFDAYRLFGQSRPLDAQSDPNDRNDKWVPKPPESPEWAEIRDKANEALMKSKDLRLLANLGTALLRTNGSRKPDALDAAFQQESSSDGLNRMLVIDAETQLPDDLLLLTDKMSMATSLECRVPLLDHELVELAARMPESVKVRRGRLKHAMKRSVSTLLPRDILSRRKRGFGMPMGAWLRTELSPLVAHLLSKPVVEKRGLLAHPSVERVIADHHANRVDGTDKLLSLIALEIWARIFLDRRSPEDVSAELKAVIA